MRLGFKIEKIKCKYCDKTGEQIKVWNRDGQGVAYEGNWCEDFSHREKAILGDN